MKGLLPHVTPRAQLARGSLDGYYMGKVTNNALGADKGAVVEVVIGAFDSGLTLPYARVLTPFAAAGAGYVWWPAVDEHVLVAFIDGKIEQPVVMGAVWDNNNPPPEPASSEASPMVLKTKGGLRLIVDDAQERILLVHADGETAVILDKEQTVVQSAGDIVIKAKGDVGIAAKAIAVQGADSVVYKGTQAVTLAGAKASIGGGGLALSGSLQLNPTGAASLKPPAPKGMVAPQRPGKLGK